jgi:hypothetical protein
MLISNFSSFWQEWIPYTEATATVLETAFDAGIFGVKLPLSEDGARYAVLNPNGTGKHHQYATQMPRPLLSHAQSDRLRSIIRDGNNPARNIRRGWEGKSIPKSVEPVRSSPAVSSTRKQSVVNDLIDLSGSGNIPPQQPPIMMTQPQSFMLQSAPLHRDNSNPNLPTNSPAFVPTQSPTIQHRPSNPPSPVVTVVTHQQMPQDSPGSRRSSSVSRSDVKVSRGDGVLKEGYVTKKSGRVFMWKDRWLSLTKDFLAIYADRTKEKAKIPIGKITRSEVVKSNQGAGDSNPNSSKNDNCHFNVFALNGHVYYFRAASPADAEDWATAIMETRFPDTAPKAAPEPVPAPTTTTVVTTVSSIPSDPAVISVGIPPQGYVQTVPQQPIPQPVSPQMPHQPMFHPQTVGYAPNSYVASQYGAPYPGGMSNPQLMTGQPMPGQPMPAAPQMMPGQPMPIQSMPPQQLGYPQQYGQPMPQYYGQPMPGQPMPVQPQSPPMMHMQVQPMQGQPMQMQPPTGQPYGYQGQPYPQYQQPPPQQMQPQMQQQPQPQPGVQYQQPYPGQYQQPPTQQFSNMRM